MNYEFPNIEDMTKEEIDKFAFTQINAMISNGYTVKKLNKIMEDSTITHDTYIFIDKTLKTINKLKDKLGFITIDDMFEHYRNRAKKLIEEVDEIRESNIRSKNRLHR